MKSTEQFGAIKNAYDMCKTKLAQEVIYDDKTPYFYELFSILFEAGARYIEHYAYDFMITWNQLLDIIAEINNRQESFVTYIPFGIRANGVDGIHRVMDTCDNVGINYISTHFDNYYRRLYCVEVRRELRGPEDGTKEWCTVVTLKDIRSCVPLAYKAYLEKASTQHKDNC